MREIRVKSPFTPSTPAAEASLEKHQQLLRKLQMAMKVCWWGPVRVGDGRQTISSQDMWIDILNRKLRGLDAQQHSDVSREVAHLQDQVTTLKRSIAGAGDDKCVHCVDRRLLMLIRSAALTEAEAEELRRSVAALQTRVQHAVEFRDRIIRALGDDYSICRQSIDVRQASTP